MKPFSGKAYWIWSQEGIGARPTQSGDHYRVRYFRREFELGEDGVDHLRLFVSADSRYRLWLNDRELGRGPARGDVAHHFYEEYCIDRSWLKVGKNVIAIWVVYCGDVMPTYWTTGAPCGLMTGAPGLIVDGGVMGRNGEVLEALQSDAAWRVRMDDGAFRHAHCESHGTYTGFTERFFGECYPWGWRKAEFGGEGFEAATMITAGVRPDTVRDSFMPHRLYPREIPFMDEREQEFVRSLLSGGERIYPAGQRMEFIVETEVLTTAWMKLRWRGGRGARIRLTYAEVFTENKLRVTQGGEIAGVYDEIISGGGEEHWESWHYRTFRYIKVEIETAGEPLVLSEFGATFWAYPFQLKASFEAEDSFLGRLVPIAHRSLQLCSHETYEDCPYYEQLSYAGDNYVLAELAAALAGDTRLTAHTIRMHFWSRNAEGLTMSRYPSRMPQVIPAWSQLWILTLASYFESTGDRSLVSEVFDGVRSIIEWFEARCEAGGRGVVGPLSYWCVLDWSPEWRERYGFDDAGVPPGTYTEASAANSMLHLWCLKEGVILARAIGKERWAEEWNCRFMELREAVHRTFWVPEKSLYSDRRGGIGFSQITNALAILSGTLEAALWKSVAGSLFDSNLDRAALFGQYFLFKAAGEAGCFGAVWCQFETYRAMFDEEGLTTFPAVMNSPRSQCHGWSAGGVVALLHYGLGVRSNGIGWERILVAPQPDAMKRLKGRVPIPDGGGIVEVDLNAEEEGWRLRVTTPEGRDVALVLPDGTRRVFPNGGCVELKSNG